MPEFETRYAPTWIDPRTGLRTLMVPAQRRYMSASLNGARNHLAAILGEHNGTRPEEVWGARVRETARVDPVKCWPEHGDPVGIYIDEPTPEG